MIAELFYPKELKDIIADLRAKDDLNEEALNNVRKEIERLLRAHSILFILLICICYYASINGDLQSSTILVVVFILSFICIFIGIYQNVRRVCCYHVCLFNKGELVEGKILKCSKNKPFEKHGARSWEFEYSYSDKKGNSHHARLILLLRYNDRIYARDESIYVFYDPQSPQRSMIALPKLYNNFNLKKSMIEEASKNS